LGRKNRRNGSSPKSEDLDLDFSRGMAERRRWKAVLNEVYSVSPHEYGRSTEGFTDTHPLAKRLKISGHELMLSISFLEDHGLIEYRNNNYIILTKRGFDVALDNERSRSSVRLQGMAVYVSLILATTAIFNFLNSTSLASPIVLTGAYLVSLVVLYLYAFHVFSR